MLMRHKKNDSRRFYLYPEVGSNNNTSKKYSADAYLTQITSQHTVTATMVEKVYVTYNDVRLRQRRHCTQHVV